MQMELTAMSGLVLFVWPIEQKLIVIFLPRYHKAELVEHAGQIIREVVVTPPVTR